MLPNQQQHPLKRSKANIPELLSSSLIRGCLSEKTFIIPALKNTLWSSLVFLIPPKSSQKFQPSFSCCPADPRSGGTSLSFSCKIHCSPQELWSCSLHSNPTSPEGQRGAGPCEPWPDSQAALNSCLWHGQSLRCSLLQQSSSSSITWSYGACAREREFMQL